ncbi:MAG: SprT family zinc-dependent metalloprotease [Bacteroidota bacterium]
MPVKVVHLKHIGNVTFSKNKRSKNIKISVKPDKSVLVSYPFYILTKKVVSFVQKNEDWIRRQQLKMESKKTRIKVDSELKTKLHTILFLKGTTNKIRKEGNKIQITVTDFGSDESLFFIEKNVTEVYRNEAKRLLPVRLKALAERHGFQFNKVSIRNNRRNWGSCSSKNNISLNLQMMKLPVELIDYIMLHELVHTEIKNHSPDFWKRLNGITNNRARELAKQVRQYSTYTL